MQITWVEPRRTLQAPHVHDGQPASLKANESFIAEALKGPIDMHRSQRRRVGKLVLRHREIKLLSVTRPIILNLACISHIRCAMR
jgi:hypothetical protein